MGLSAEECQVLLDMRLAALKGAPLNGINPNLPKPVDLFALWDADSNESWLVLDLWPSERQVHLHAKRKTGKSLVALWMAANMAIGRDPFTGFAITPVRVAYLDYEMTESDLRDRLEAMGFTPDILAANFRYWLHPMIPPLDTKAGGEALLELLTAYECQAVLLDTFARVVVGDENNNDTYRAFFKWTGSLLKNAGIALLRLDHEGHTEGRSRGASAKADDVDVVFQLRETDDGYQFVRKASRIDSITEIISVTRTLEPLGFTRASASWPNGTIEKVRELDGLEIPNDASRRAVATKLKEAGLVVGKTTVLNAAIRYRQHRILGL